MIRLNNDLHRYQQPQPSQIVSYAVQRAWLIKTKASRHRYLVSSVPSPPLLMIGIELACSFHFSLHCVKLMAPAPSAGGLCTQGLQSFVIEIQMVDVLIMAIVTMWVETMMLWGMRGSESLVKITKWLTLHQICVQAPKLLLPRQQCSWCR